MTGSARCCLQTRQSGQLRACESTLSNVYCGDFDRVSCSTLCLGCLGPGGGRREEALVRRLKKQNLPWLAWAGIDSTNPTVLVTTESGKLPTPSQVDHPTTNKSSSFQCRGTCAILSVATWLAGTPPHGSLLQRGLVGRPGFSTASAGRTISPLWPSYALSLSYARLALAFQKFSLHVRGVDLVDASLHWVRSAQHSSEPRAPVAQRLFASRPQQVGTQALPSPRFILVLRDACSVSAAH